MRTWGNTLQTHAHVNTKPKWLCIWVRYGNFALTRYHLIRKPATPQQQHKQHQCTQWYHINTIIMDILTDAKLNSMNSFVTRYKYNLQFTSNDSKFAFRIREIFSTCFCHYGTWWLKETWSSKWYECIIGYEIESPQNIWISIWKPFKWSDGDC